MIWRLMKMITKRIKYFLFVMLMLAGINNVSATSNDNIIDFNKKGSISITLSEVEDDTKVSGASITIYKVADAILENNNLVFDYHDSLKKYKVNFDNGIITDEMLKIISKEELVSYSNITNDLGVVEFIDLDLGLYLVVQNNQVEGFSRIDPFLVYIPQVIENKWIYEVDIIRLFDLGVEKVWNVSTDIEIPKEVIIELLKDEKVIDTVILNNDNNWTYLWKQIEMSDNYLIREKDVPDGYTVTYKKNGDKFIVTNTKNLVQTGRDNFIVPMIGFIGFLFIVVGIYFEKRKKYE